jgi:hypothetical protein
MFHFQFLVYQEEKCERTLDKLQSINLIGSFQKFLKVKNKPRKNHIT